MLVTCSIGRTSHQSLILYTVARLDTRWRDIEDGNGLPVTTGDGKSSCFFGINISSKSIDPAEIIPNGKHNPAIFVRGSVSSSKVDKIVDDRNQVNTNMSIKDVKVIIDERPRHQ